MSPEGKNGDQMGKRKCISAPKENKGIDEAKRTEDSRKIKEKGERGRKVSPLVILGPPNDCSIITFRPNARHVSKPTHAHDEKYGKERGTNLSVQA